MSQMDWNEETGWYEPLETGAREPAAPAAQPTPAAGGKKRPGVQPSVW